jgi:DNA-directed RNA polymerase specialized sigma subunit
MPTTEEDIKMNTKDYRVTLKIRNNNLLRLIEEGGTGPVETAKLIGICYARLNDYLNMVISPLQKKTGNLKESAQLICDYFCVMPYEVWSENQLTALVTNKRDFEFTHQELTRLEKSNDPMKAVCNSEIIEAFDYVITALTDREQKVLNARYGIDGEEKTLDVIAKEFNMSSERIRQIETKALRRLRHNERMKEVFELLADS